MSNNSSNKKIKPLILKSYVPEKDYRNRDKSLTPLFNKEKTQNKETKTPENPTDSPDTSISSSSSTTTNNNNSSSLPINKKKKNNNTSNNNTPSSIVPSYSSTSFRPYRPPSSPVTPPLPNYPQLNQQQQHPSIINNNHYLSPHSSPSHQSNNISNSNSIVPLQNFKRLKKISNKKKSELDKLNERNSERLAINNSNNSLKKRVNHSSVLDHKTPSKNVIDFSDTRSKNKKGEPVCSSRNWSFVVHNPLLDGSDDPKLWIPSEYVKSIVYQYERGELNGNIHIQGVVSFHNTMTLSRLLKFNPKSSYQENPLFNSKKKVSPNNTPMILNNKKKVFWQIVKGGFMKNIQYCTKEKSRVIINPEALNQIAPAPQSAVADGTNSTANRNPSSPFLIRKEPYRPPSSTPPVYPVTSSFSLPAPVIDINHSAGKRSDLYEIQDYINDDPSPTLEYIADNWFSSFVRYSTHIQKYLAFKSKKRAWKTEVTFCYGSPGTGKSRFSQMIASSYGTVPYYVKDGSKWFDNYSGNSNIVMDDFYGGIPFNVLLQLLDRYPAQVEFKGGYVNFAPQRIFITSNRWYIFWYSQSNHNLSVDAVKTRMQALFRRFTNILIFTEDQSVAIYKGKIPTVEGFQVEMNEKLNYKQQDSLINPIAKTAKTGQVVKLFKNPLFDESRNPNSLTNDFGLFDPIEEDHSIEMYFNNSSATAATTTTTPVGGVGVSLPLDPSNNSHDQFFMLNNDRFSSFRHSHSSSSSPFSPSTVSISNDLLNSNFDFENLQIRPDDFVPHNTEPIYPIEEDDSLIDLLEESEKQDSPYSSPLRKGGVGRGEVLSPQPKRKRGKSTLASKNSSSMLNHSLSDDYSRENNDYSDFSSSSRTTRVSSDFGASQLHSPLRSQLTSSLSSRPHFSFTESYQNSINDNHSNRNLSSSSLLMRDSNNSNNSNKNNNSNSSSSSQPKIKSPSHNILTDYEEIMYFDKIAEAPEENQKNSSVPLRKEKDNSSSKQRPINNQISTGFDREENSFDMMQYDGDDCDHYGDFDDDQLLLNEGVDNIESDEDLLYSDNDYNDDNGDENTLSDLEFINDNHSLSENSSNTDTESDEEKENLLKKRKNKRFKKDSSNKILYAKQRIEEEEKRETPQQSKATYKNINAFGHLVSTPSSYPKSKYNTSLSPSSYTYNRNYTNGKFGSNEFSRNKTTFSKSSNNHFSPSYPSSYSRSYKNDDEEERGEYMRRRENIQNNRNQEEEVEEEEQKQKNPQNRETQRAPAQRAPQKAPSNLSFQKREERNPPTPFKKPYPSSRNVSYPVRKHSHQDDYLNDEYDDNDDYEMNHNHSTDFEDASTLDDDDQEEDFGEEDVYSDLSSYNKIINYRRINHDDSEDDEDDDGEDVYFENNNQNPFSIVKEPNSYYDESYLEDEYYSQEEREEEENNKRKRDNLEDESEENVCNSKKENPQKKVKFSNETNANSHNSENEEMKESAKEESSSS